MSDHNDDNAIAPPVAIQATQARGEPVPIKPAPVALAPVAQAQTLGLAFAQSVAPQHPLCAVPLQPAGAAATVAGVAQVLTPASGARPVAMQAATTAGAPQQLVGAHQSQGAPRPELARPLPSVANAATAQAARTAQPQARAPMAARPLEAPVEPTAAPVAVASPSELASTMTPAPREK